MADIKATSDLPVYTLEADNNISSTGFSVTLSGATGYGSTWLEDPDNVAASIRDALAAAGWPTVSVTKTAAENTILP